MTKVTATCSAWWSRRCYSVWPSPTLPRTWRLSVCQFIKAPPAILVSCNHLLHFFWVFENFLDFGFASGNGPMSEIAWMESLVESRSFCLPSGCPRNIMLTSSRYMCASLHDQDLWHHNRNSSEYLHDSWWHAFNLDVEEFLSNVPSNFELCPSTRTRHQKWKVIQLARQRLDSQGGAYDKGARRFCEMIHIQMHTVDHMILSCIANLSDTLIWYI